MSIPNRTLCSPLLVVAALVAGGALARADDLLSPGTPIERTIDHYIKAGLDREGIAPAPPADDATLIRRLTLDLVGRVPTAAESRAYLESNVSEKRDRLVDRLLTAPGFARHLATELDSMMMAGSRGSLRDYLLRAVGEDRSWDRIFREVMLPDEADPARKGAGEFLRERVKDLDRMTNEVSTTFFGINVSCARCHDHPLVSDWTQDHFFGMKAFFARTFENEGFLAERGYGSVEFKTTDGEERQARMMFLTGRVVDEPAAKEPTDEERKQEQERLDDCKKRKVPPPPPTFSARAQLVELALQPGERDFFARAIVNRVWHRFFGRGLVMPLDQMHSENPASHPELIQWLARDLVEHGYDLRRLIRGIALSEAYERGSRWEGETPPRPQLFAVAAVRPLTSMQLARSLRLATIDPASLPSDLKPEELERRLEAWEGAALGDAGQFGPSSEDRQIGTAEALLFSNGERIEKEYLADGPDRLVGRLVQIKDRRALVDLAVRTVLSRPASDEEVELLGGYVERRSDRPVESCRQIVWALLASSEFRFNH